MRKERPVTRKKAAIECNIEARQRAHSRRERRGSMSDGKGDGRETKEKSNDSKIKKEMRKHTESECRCPYTAKMTNETYGRERGMGHEVSSSTCMTRG